MDTNAQKIREKLLKFYPAEEWPTLLYQADEWAKTRPLEGLKILDVTPLYRNTLGKFMALLAAGADLYVPDGWGMPADRAILASIEEYGIHKVGKKTDGFDIILDCSGRCHRQTHVLGACELTRSGVPRYEHTHRPVFSVDDSRIKRIETTLGTGESFFRALRKLGTKDFTGRRLLVIGYGKVGRGVVHYARQNGMKVMVADIVDKSGELPGDVHFVNVNDVEAFNEAILRAWCAVTVTGKEGALRHKLHAASIIDSPVILANMGVEDEYSSEIPASRVLNHKQPLNFILSDPTSMRFIETTMALHNACALDLLTPDLPHRCMPPCPDVEERLLHIATTRGAIAADLDQMSFDLLA